MQQIKLIRNKDRGLDILLSDGKNNVRVETGNKENSLEYWKELKAIANEAIDTLTRPQPDVHVVLIGAPMKGNRRVIHKTYRPRR